jgi:hypothetical protein
MKRYLLIFAMLLGVVSLTAQTPTVANLAATGTGIKWYDASTGGNLLPSTTVLVNGQHYYASQTVNGCESTTRLDVVASVVTVEAPVASTHVPSQTQIVWNWNSVTGATGYKWSTSNNYSSATDMGTALTKTEAGLTCNTACTRFVWAYNASGCVSVVTTLTQTTSACPLAIGDSYQGGKIAYIDGTGLHGFIVSSTDIGTGWGWSNITVGGTSTALGTGLSNTNKIVGTADNSNPNAGALVCYNLVEGGYSDWYLPSKDELDILHNNKALFGMTYAAYQSSSETGSDSAYGQWFITTGSYTDGEWSQFQKSSMGPARAIRSF